MLLYGAWVYLRSADEGNKRDYSDSNSECDSDDMHQRSRSKSKKKKTKHEEKLERVDELVDELKLKHGTMYTVPCLG